MDAHDLGRMFGCLEYGFSPRSIDYIEGAASRGVDGGVGRQLFKAAHDIMSITGRGSSAPALHLMMLSKQADWTLHSDEVFRDISRLLLASQPMEKAAFSGAASLANTGAKALTTGTLAGGAGLGALYFMLNRHATQDEADSEAMQHQVDYYNHLSRELEDSMRRKYHYDQGSNATRRAPR